VVLDVTAAAGGRASGTVFGRDGELACAEAFLASAAQGSAALVVEGEAGIGKTTVWQQVITQAGDLGFRVLAARPVEVETKLSLTAVADLLELVPREAFVALPQPQRRALDIALLRAEPSGEALDPRTVATAVRSLLGELSAERPLIVAIDDVQWLDPTSATVLAFAMRRLGGQPVGWLCARRIEEGPAPVTVDTLFVPDALTRVTLGPLTVGALHHVVKEHLERPLSRAALVRVHEASGGNPFYALEISRALGDRAPLEPGARLPLPASLRELVAARIPTLEPDVRDALLASAALSQPTADLVERASSAAGLAAAEETGLLSVDGADRVVFVHPLYASTVYAAAATGRRRALHRRLAGLVTDREERARHLAVAAAEPDEDVARALEDAAAAARSRGAWASAADLLEHARSLTPTDRGDDAARRALAAAEHHVRAGDRTHARALAESVLEGAALPRALRADALRLCAEISYNADNSVDAVRLYEQALGCADDPQLAGTIELGLCYVKSNLMQFPAASGHAHRALELVERGGNRALVAAALAHCVMMDFLCARGVDWDMVERSVSLDGADGVVPVVRRAGTLAAFLQLYVGRHAEARERLHAIWAHASDRGDESDLAFVLLWLSWLETRSGELDTAARVGEEAISLATLTGTPSMRAWVLTQQAYVQAHLGAVEETRLLCARAATGVERSGNLLPLLWIAASLAVLELSLGDASAAWAACEPLVVALEAHGVGEPVPSFFLPDALEALIALGGGLGRAEALIDAFEARGRQLDRAWALATGARCRGLLLAARGDLAGAQAALERALAEHERVEMPLELARTLLVAGVIQRRARKRAGAKASFERALALFEDSGARLWAQRARAELDRLGLRHASGELTESERRVAELAAQGLTNRKVAAALFISPKTVDANLARVYRKLGIASRAELGARMAALVEDGRIMARVPSDGAGGR
jgi:DNA-binding CsgD family transcriptional regulator